MMSLTAQSTSLIFFSTMLAGIMLLCVEKSNCGRTSKPIEHSSSPDTPNPNVNMQLNPLLKLSKQHQIQLDEEGDEEGDEDGDEEFDEGFDTYSPDSSRSNTLPLKPMFGFVIDEKLDSPFKVLLQDSDDVIRSLNPDHDCRVLNLTVSLFLNDDVIQKEKETFSNVAPSSWLQVSQTKAFKTLIKVFDSINQAISCQMKHLNVLNKQMIACIDAATARSCHCFHVSTDHNASNGMYIAGIQVFLDQINAWKRLYLFLFSKYMDINVEQINDGVSFSVSDDTYDDELFQVQLQFDCINYIFRRFLHELAVKLQLYHNRLIDLNVSNLNKVNSIYYRKKYIIDYFACEYSEYRLNEFGLWIQSAFGKSKFYDGEWMNQAIENVKYENIFEIDAHSIGEWIVYTMKLDTASKTKQLKHSQVRDILFNPATNWNRNIDSQSSKSQLSLENVDSLDMKSELSSLGSAGTVSSGDDVTHRATTTSTTSPPKRVKSKKINCCACM